jgi:bifunctional DNase/RNase
LGEVNGNRRLPIIIGAFEAQSIALELEKIQPPRPMTHDLIRDLFNAVGAEVTDIVIDELREGTFFAKIRYSIAGASGQLDARPSDAVALAVRVDAPIFVDSAVLDEAGIPTDDSDEESVEDVSETVGEPASDEPKSALEKLEDDLQTAIAEEDYERAARLRDDISRLKSESN